MADVKLRIEVNPDAAGQSIDSITNYQNSTATNANISNTSIQANSNGVFDSTQGITLSGSNGLSFSDDDFVFSGDDFLGNFNDETVAVVEDEQNPAEFIWGIVPANGQYNVKLTFSSESTIEKIFVYGDTVSNQYPTEAIIDDTTTIYSDDPTWAIDLGEPASTHTIEFTKWNRSNYNACLTGINVMLQYYDVDKTTGLKVVTSTTQSITNADEIQYGILPNTGSASIVDVNGELADLVKDGIVPYYDVNCELMLNGNKIQHHVTTDSDYYEDKILKLNFKNSLSQLPNKKFPGMPLQHQMTAFDVLVYIYNTLGYTDSSFVVSQLQNNMILNNGQIGTVKQHLDEIEIPFPFMEESSYSEAFDKICEIGQLNMIEDDDGNTCFVSARPKMASSNNIISLPRYLQETLPSDSLFVKNKINNISYLYNKATFDWELIHNETFNFLADSDDISASGDRAPEYVTINGYRVQMKYVERADIAFGETYEFCKIDLDGQFLFDDRNFQLELASNSSNAGDSFGVPIGFPWKINLLSHSTAAFKYYNSFEGFLQQNFIWDTSSSAYKYKPFVDTSISYIGDCFCIIPSADGKFELYGYIHTTAKEGIISGDNINWNKIRYVSPLTIKLYGYKLNQESISNELTSFDYELRTNELIQNIATVNTLCNNIIADYGDGIKSTEIKIKLMDLYDINGNLVKDYASGDILQIGDIVRIDKDNVGNSAFTYTNGYDIFWKVVGRTFNYSGVPTATLQLQEVKRETTLQSISWDEINSYAKNGRAAQLFNVGEEKTITLSNNEEVTFAIMGFNHDDLSGVNGKAGITFGMTNLLSDTYQMNLSNTDTGGWDHCYMRTNTMNDLFGFFPSDLQSVIKTVQKRTSTGEYSQDIYISNDKLWLFSMVEVMNFTNGVFGKEGTQYTYWNTIKDGENVAEDRIKYLNNGQGNAHIWWFRSSYPPVGTTKRNFRYIDEHGQTLGGQESNSYCGVCLGFCV